MHPTWVYSESGQQFVDRTEYNDQILMEARRREQELHREAAVRQLDTLRQLEEGQRNEREPAIGAMHESYLQRPASTADAGAGSGPFDPTQNR